MTPASMMRSTPPVDAIGGVLGVARVLENTLDRCVLNVVTILYGPKPAIVLALTYGRKYVF